MKIIVILLFCLKCIVWPSLVMADDFPQSYISRQLLDAKKSIEVKVSMIKPGQLIMVEYVDMPIWIYRRTPNDLTHLSKADLSKLADPRSKNLMSSIEAAYGSSSSYVWARLLLVNQPEIERNAFRSINDEFLVVSGWGTHSGCHLEFHSHENRSEEGVAFYDPCVGASYDVAGRIIKGCLSGMAEGQNAGYNMYIPPHWYNGKETLTIGVPESYIIPDIHISLPERYLGLNPTKKLITASLYNDIETVKQTLREGANVNYYKYGEGNPLNAAIIGSSMEVIQLLIDSGAKPQPNSIKIAEFVGREEVTEILKETQ